MTIRKVMVVDEDDETRVQCLDILVENGFEVAEAATGDDAILVYDDFQPDLVFMDMTTPDSESLLALQELIEMDPEAKVAVAMVLGQNSSVKLAIKMGAVDFLLKPLSQEQVMRTVYRTWG